MNLLHITNIRSPVASRIFNVLLLLYLFRISKAKKFLTEEENFFFYQCRLLNHRKPKNPNPDPHQTSLTITENGKFYNLSHWFYWVDSAVSPSCSCLKNEGKGSNTICRASNHVRVLFYPATQLVMF